MASTSVSSNDSSRAPESFNITSSHEHDDWTAGCVMKCPMCMYTRKSFHCRNCVRDGNFVPSNQDRATAERFSIKKARFDVVQKRHRELTERAATILQRHKEREAMIFAIKTKQENIEMLEKELEKRKQQHANSKAENDRLKKHLDETRRKFPQYENNVQHLHQFVDRRCDENKASTVKRNQLRAELKARTTYFIHTLVKYIFPISNVPHDYMDGSDTEAVSQLSDAQRTAYIRGRWITQDSENEQHHIMVAPMLPGNGDYSAYLEWVASNKDGVPIVAAGSGAGGPGAGGGGEVLSSQNDAYRISAALTYTTQFVALLSYILDIHLPFHVHYRDFCNKELTAESFTRRVARLNANILALCYTQNVNPKLLSATHTLANLQKLLTTPGLGCSGPVEVSYLQLQDIEHVTADLAGEDSDDEADENSLSVEWESISHLSINETVSALPQQQPSPPISTQQTVSIAGGLMNNAVASVTSIWRGFTGR